MKLARLARVLAIAASAVSAASCRQLLGLDSPSGGGGDAGGSAIDAPLDAPVCPSAAVSCLDANTLLTCTMPGVVGTLTACAWGCDPIDGAAKCYAVVPAGGGVLPGDVMPDSMLGDVTITGTVTLDADAGTISTGGGSVAGFTYQLNGNVAVFRLASLTIEGTLVANGSHPVALVANGDITIEGFVDGRGGCVGLAGGPGGGSGGNRTETGGGSGGGQFGQMNDGGGGGGHGGSGGSGGSHDSQMAAGGSSFGDEVISTLAGGGGGGGGQGSGGGGGGGIQLVSNGTITIAAGGGINVGGCGGQNNGSPSGGGGGAGGTILLEAPAITIVGALAANGGGGGGGGPSGMSGSAGSLDRTPAAGGLAGASGGRGGMGAAGATRDGAVGFDANYSGGGGGAIGRIRINSRRGTGATIESGAVMSPAFSDPATTATQGSAVVQ
ncbi:MAG TPA: hypothetical protein VGF94_20310 [Kofleriaceae bacterium]